VDGRRRRGAGAALSVSRQEVRAAAKRRRARRGMAISALSTLIIIGGLAAVVVTSPGWDDVKATYFDWGDFKDAFPDVLKGFWLDVKLFVIVELCVLVVGLVVALVRTTRSPALFPLRLMAGVFTDVTRGVPVVLFIYLVGFGVLALDINGLPTDPLVLGGAALTLSYSGYVAEVYRSGIDSVHPSQLAGALALGLTRGQALRHVVLPQAVRRVVPPLLNDFIALQKDVALISFLGPMEAFRVAQIEAASNFIYTPLVAAAVLYLCVTIPMARIVDHLQARSRTVRGVAEVTG
jgi:polar amino acid transport system permease protein